MRGIEAVLLDIGGVFNLPVPSRVAEACSRAGHPIDEAGVPRAHYRGATVFDHPGEDALAPVDRWWPEYLREFARSLGITDETLITEIVANLVNEFTTGGLWDYEIPGARQGLQALADKGLRLGIITNNDGEALTRLRAAELAQVGPGVGVNVECVIDSGAVGLEKPDPRIFELALIAMRIEPSKCIYVGDMPGIDAVGATRAGIKPFIIDPYQDHDGAGFAGAEFQSIESLGALAELF